VCKLQRLGSIEPPEHAHFVLSRSIPQLLSKSGASTVLVNQSWDIRWVSPLAADTYSEYQHSEFLERVGLGLLATRLLEFWPRGGPCWDALAQIEDGCLIIEAKSHVPEIYGGGCGASPGSRQKIQTALDATKTWLSVPSCSVYVDEVVCVGHYSTSCFFPLT